MKKNTHFFEHYPEIAFLIAPQKESTQIHIRGKNIVFKKY